MLVCEALNHSVFNHLIYFKRTYNQDKKAGVEIISKLQLFETSYIFFSQLHFNKVVLVLDIIVFMSVLKAFILNVKLNRLIIRGFQSWLIFPSSP